MNVTHLKSCHTEHILGWPVDKLVKPKVRRAQTKEHRRCDAERKNFRYIESRNQKISLNESRSRISSIIMRRKKIKSIQYASLTALSLLVSGCSSLNTVIPEACTTGVPTNKNCFTTSGNKGSLRMGPFNVIHAEF